MWAPASVAKMPRSAPMKSSSLCKRSCGVCMTLVEHGYSSFTPHPHELVLFPTNMMLDFVKTILRAARAILRRWPINERLAIRFSNPPQARLPMMHSTPCHHHFKPVEMTQTRQINGADEAHAHPHTRTHAHARTRRTCTHARASTNVQARTCTHTRASTSTRARTHTHTRTHVHTHTHRHTETHRDTQRHIETHRDTQRHTETPRHPETHTHTHTHTQTRTHTHTPTYPYPTLGWIGASRLKEGIVCNVEPQACVKNSALRCWYVGHSARATSGSLLDQLPHEACLRGPCRYVWLIRPDITTHWKGLRRAVISRACRHPCV